MGCLFFWCTRARSVHSKALLNDSCNSLPLNNELLRPHCAEIAHSNGIRSGRNSCSRDSDAIPAGAELSHRRIELGPSSTKKFDPHISVRRGVAIEIDLVGSRVGMNSRQDQRSHSQILR